MYLERDTVYVLIIASYVRIFSHAADNDPCTVHDELNNTVIYDAACKSVLSPTWYRYTGNNDGILSTVCPVGTSTTSIWMNDTIPTESEGEKDIKICIQKGEDCCEQGGMVKMKNCSDFVVFFHRRTPPDCSVEYSFHPPLQTPVTTQIPVTTTQSSTQTSVQMLMTTRPAIRTTSTMTNGTTSSNLSTQGSNTYEENTSLPCKVEMCALGIVNILLIVCIIYQHFFVKWQMKKMSRLARSDIPFFLRSDYKGVRHNALPPLRLRPSFINQSNSVDTFNQ